MNRIIHLFVFVSLFIVSWGVHAKSEYTYLYADTEILVVDNNEIVDSIAIPEQAQNIQAMNSFNVVGLSPDLNHLVFVQDTVDDNNQPMSSLFIANLEEETCCISVEDPTENGAEVIGVGVFSPDSAQVVVTFNRTYFPPTETVTAIIDLETGAIVKVVNTQETFDAPILEFEDWTEDGIVYLPVGCFPCGGVPSGNYLLWNPLTDEITTLDATIPAFGDRLDSTGEIILAQRDESYPVSNADAMVGPFNVIIATNDRMSETTIVYHNPQYLHLGGPAWVMNGEAYFIQLWDQPSGLVINREGNVSEVPVAQTSQFLTATPQGWLMYDFQAQTMYAYHLQDGEWVQSDLGQYESIRLLQSPIIGEGVESGLAVVQ